MSFLLSENPMVRLVQRRLHYENRNFLAVITGETGSGKSWAALRLAESIDPDFTIANVAFTQEQFMALLNSGRLKRGSCIVWDEVGINQSAKEFYETANKLINFVFQTFRKDNLAVLVTSPFSSFVDSDTRKMFHGMFRSLGRKGNKSYFKYYEIQFNELSKKWFFIRPRIGGRIIDKLSFNAPSKILLDAYEPLHQEYKDKLKQKIGAEISKIRITEQSRRIDARAVAADVLRAGDKFMRVTRKNKSVDKELVETHFGVGEGIGRRVRTMVNRALKNAEYRQELERGSGTTTDIVK